MPVWPANDQQDHVAWHEGSNSLLFGRWGGVDCIIEHPSCSRQHAWLGWDADGILTLEDLGSAAGTSVNGSPVPGGVQKPLAPGDSVTFGESTRSFTVRERRAAALDPSAPDPSLDPSLQKLVREEAGGEGGESRKRKKVRNCHKYVLNRPLFDL